MSVGIAKHHIKLTDEEMDLLASIDLQLEVSPHTDKHSIYLSNKEPILALLSSLSERKAIPESRLKYWNDPAYKPGRIKASHKGIFERNGRQGSEIYTHPNFIPFLRYFLFGADLPSRVITEFEAKLGDPKWFGGSDILELVKETRAIVRRHHLTYDSSDEFHKLAIDNGLNHYHAEAVRKAAVEAARR